MVGLEACARHLPIMWRRQGRDDASSERHPCPSRAGPQQTSAPLPHACLISTPFAPARNPHASAAGPTQRGKECGFRPRVY